MKELKELHEKVAIEQEIGLPTFYKLAKVSRYIQKNSKVLDVGCAEGRLSNFVGKHNYFGVDFSETSLKKAKENNSNVVLCDANRLPFKDEIFDFCSLLDVLEHSISPFNLLKECNRVLKKKGGVIISVPNPYYFLYLILIFLRVPGYPKIHKGHLQTFTLPEIKNLFSITGFELEDMKGTHLYHRIKPFSLSSYLGDVFTIVSHAIIYGGRKK